MTTLTSLIRISLLTAALLLSGCATTQYDDGVSDPWQGYNRVMYSFNDATDSAIIKPVAQAYATAVPDPIQTGISNFFNNLNAVTVIINDLLQFKFGQALDDTGYFLLNSTVGIAGIFDVAGYAGYKSHNEDFGQTLGYWGVTAGPYVVLPFFGPSTARDAVGLIGDYSTDLTFHIKDAGARDKLTVLQIIDVRSRLLSAEKILDQATDDEYMFVRDAYLQRRQNLIYDGSPPEEDFDVFADE